jgi:hypothetical protein
MVLQGQLSGSGLGANRVGVTCTGPTLIPRPMETPGHSWGLFTEQGGYDLSNQQSNRHCGRLLLYRQMSQRSCTEHAPCRPPIMPDMGGDLGD